MLRPYITIFPQLLHNPCSVTSHDFLHTGHTSSARLLNTTSRTVWDGFLNIYLKRCMNLVGLDRIELPSLRCKLRIITVIRKAHMLRTTSPSWGITRKEVPIECYHYNKKYNICHYWAPSPFMKLRKPLKNSQTCVFLSLGLASFVLFHVFLLARGHYFSISGI